MKSGHKYINLKIVRVKQNLKAKTKKVQLRPNKILNHLSSIYFSSTKLRTSRIIHVWLLNNITSKKSDF